MKWFKLLAPALCAVLALASISVRDARADAYSQKTIVTFSGPVEIPGYRQPMVLPAGTYVFKLLDSIANRNIVQIFNKDENHLYSTILAISDYRLKPANKTVISFEERSAGSPEAIKAWFYPGDTDGLEFVYPKARAVQLAKNANEPVLSMPENAASNFTQPAANAKAPSVAALEKTPVKAEQPSGQEVEMAQVVQPKPSNTNSNANSANAARKSSANLAAKNELPKTASSMPLWALAGMLLCAGGASLRFVAKRIA